MPADSARTRAMDATRTRILDVSLDTLGRNPEAGMGDIAIAAGVVRRTVYGYFPTRAELIGTLAQQALAEITTVLAEIDAANGPPERAWVDFLARLWPLVHRYRVLVALRRGEFGREIHALLAPVDRALAALVQRGQDAEVFGQHLPAPILSQIAFSAIFTLADLSDTTVTSEAATLTSLLLLGVPEARARSLSDAPI